MAEQSQSRSDDERSLSEKRIKEIAGEACVLDGIGAAPYKNVIAAIQKALSDARARMFQPDWANFRQGRADGFAEGREVTDDMVNRFLNWKLPEDFSPDCGVSFDGRKADQWNPSGKGWPVGTNLLTADQARQMLSYVLGHSSTSIAQRQAEEAAMERNDEFLEAMNLLGAKDGETLLDLAHRLTAVPECGTRLPSDKMQHIQFEGRDCIVMAPEDYDQLERELAKKSDYLATLQANVHLGSMPAPVSASGSNPLYCKHDWVSVNGENEPARWQCRKCAVHCNPVSSIGALPK